MLNVMSKGDNGHVAFATSRLWGETVHVFDTDGVTLWTQEFPTVNRVSTADIDGHGADEILIGTQEGLIAKQLNGSRQWHARVGDVRNVSFLPSRHDAAALLAAHVSSDLGILDNTGTLIRRISASYGFMDVAARERHREIIAIDGPTLRAFNTDGTQLWSVIDKDPRIRTVRLSSMKLSPDGHWIAAALKGGLLLVYDASNGMPLASLTDGALNYSSITWSATAEGTPLLVVAAAGGLQCFEVRPAAPVGTGTTTDVP